AASPGFLELVRQAELGTARDEAYHAMLVGIVVGFSDAAVAPVGSAEGADLTLPNQSIQSVDNGADGDVGIVTVEQIEVNIVHLHARQGIVKIGGDVEGRHAPAVRVGVRSLANDDHLLPHAAGLNPSAEDALVLATAIHMC